jgi:hypothetical protein
MATTTKKRGKPPLDEETASASTPDGDASEANDSDRNGSATNGTPVEPRKPVHVVSYLVARDTFIQASIWSRLVKLQDGTEFIAHDVSLRKCFKDGAGEWQSYYSFRGSELYAVAHAVSQANAWILDTRANHSDCPF